MDSHPSDAALLLAVADRDLGAFRVLYERHAGWLSVRLARRCNERDLLAVAVQDTFVAVWGKPEGFRGEGDIAAWLWGIAIRRLVSRMRTRRSLADVFEDAGSVPAAEDQVLLSVEYGDIGQALARLSPEIRAVIIVISTRCPDAAVSRVLGVAGRPGAVISSPSAAVPMPVENRGSVTSPILHATMG